jgi:hypothetical protein
MFKAQPAKIIEGIVRAVSVDVRDLPGLERTIALKANADSAPAAALE